MSNTQNVGVVGLRELGASLLRPVAEARRWNLIPLTSECETRRLDAVVAFDGSTAALRLPEVARQRGLLGPSSQAVLRCAHPYWNRLTQASAIPGHQPLFQAFDPYDADSIHAITLQAPLWIRPACSPEFGLRIESRSELARALSALRRVIGPTAQSFSECMALAQPPRSVERLGARSCIAESLLAGRLSIFEGYVRHGNVRTLGVVDGSTSTTGYSYPSLFPQSVQHQMAELCRKMVQALELDHCCFHAEFSWHTATDRLSMLDFQPRLAAQHAPLFLAVDGTSNLEVAIDVAVGNDPVFERGLGSHSLAVVRQPVWPAVGPTGHLRRIGQA